MKCKAGPWFQCCITINEFVVLVLLDLCRKKIRGENNHNSYEFTTTKENLSDQFENLSCNLLACLPFLNLTHSWGGGQGIKHETEVAKGNNFNRIFLTECSIVYWRFQYYWRHSITLKGSPCVILSLVFNVQTTYLPLAQDWIFDTLSGLVKHEKSKSMDPNMRNQNLGTHNQLVVKYQWQCPQPSVTPSLVSCHRWT